jgi:hypothetical protein
MSKIIRFPLFFLIISSLFLSCSEDEKEIINDTNDNNSPIIDLTFDSQIINSISPFEFLKVIKSNNEFVIFTKEILTGSSFNVAIRVSKVDSDFNLIWTFVVDRTTEGEQLAGVFELNNDEFIAIFGKAGYSSQGLHDNEVFGLKFNSLGSILWEKNYSMNNLDYNTHLDNIIYFNNSSNELKVMFKSDSTYYNADDFYYREVKINSDGDILENNKIYNSTHGLFFDIIYDNLGYKYNFGGNRVVDFYTGNSAFTSFDASLTKFNSNNSIIFNNLYGIPRIDDYFHRAIIDNNNKIILIGKYGIDYSNQTEARWIVQMDSNGNIVWEIKEYEERYQYYGKDIIQDGDNYLSLFDDRNGYNITTLIKSNNQGEILWKFKDGEKNNTENFLSQKVIKYNDEYLIFGIRDNNKLWVKKIKVIE